MFQKILVPILFLISQFLVTGYGYYTGKLAAKGSLFGWAYDSALIRAIITQFEFFWVLIIINILFSFGFNLGFQSYKNYLVIAMIWIASGPIASLIFNQIISKEKIDLAMIIGIILITTGAISVVAHKEIMDLFTK